MIRSIRGFALLAAAILFTVGGTGPNAFAEQEEPKAEKKPIEMPKLPEGSKAKWDYTSVEEKFNVLKGSINEDGQIYFLLELKEDMATTPSYIAVFTDGEGVKFYDIAASCKPATGKKGDRVRLTFYGGGPATNKETWIKTVKVTVTAR